VFILFRSNLSHGGIQLPWLAIFITAIPVVMFILFGAAPENFVFDRMAIAQGEFWRLITGHWVHSDFEHAAWDVCALFLLLTLCGKQTKIPLFSTFVIATIGIDLWLWFGKFGLDYYCGLSGVLNAIFIIALYNVRQKTRSPVVWVSGLIAVAKIIIEINAGQAMLTQTAWPSVPDIHAIGFMIGVAVVATYMVLMKMTNKHLVAA
jgi:rhomboid family GlyGly-CTERM serine protease